MDNSFGKTIQSLLTSVDSENFDNETDNVNISYTKIVKQCHSSSKEELAEGIGKILDLVHEKFPFFYYKGIIVTFLNLCGMFVELGAEFSEKTSFIYVQILSKMMGTDKKEESFLLKNLRTICPPSMHFLSKYESTREMLRKEKSILRRANDFRFNGSSFQMFHSLVETLDKEKIAIITENEDCFIFEVTGCSYLVQMQTLLSEFLVRGTEKPSKEVIQCLKGEVKNVMVDEKVKIFWDFYQWTSFRKKEALDTSETNELSIFSVPSDIAKLGDMRILVLKRKESYSVINCCRTFQPLKANVKLVKKFSKEEFLDFKSKVDNSKEKERDCARDFVLGRKMRGEKLLVIHYGSKSGFLMEFGGVSLIYQLLGLIDSELIPRYLQGVRPNDKVINCYRGKGPKIVEEVVCVNWNMFQFIALDKNGRLDPDIMKNNLDCCIWGENPSNTIKSVNGIKVMILGKKNFSHNLGNCFRHSTEKTFVRLLRVLEKGEVEKWMETLID